jgi:hypothetical protein
MGRLPISTWRKTLFADIAMGTSPSNFFLVFLFLFSLALSLSFCFFFLFSMCFDEPGTFFFLNADRSVYYVERVGNRKPNPRNAPSVMGEG